MTARGHGTGNGRLALALPALAFAVVLAAGSVHLVRAADTKLATPSFESLTEAARKYFPSEEIGRAPNKRIYRLTRDQIDATVAALLPKYVGPSVKTAMPKDPLQTNYEYAEILSFNPSNLNALKVWISDIAVRVRKDPSGLINCPAANANEDCLRSEARKFIVKAFRGDMRLFGEAKTGVENFDRTTDFFLAGVKNAGLNQAAGDLVEVVLNSPDFLFRKEVTVNRGRGIEAAQLLQAFTYTLADMPPDALKFDSSNPSQYFQSKDAERATVKAIMTSPQGREKLVRFFKTWLELKDPAEFTISAEVFPEFTPKLAGAMLDETDRYLRAQLAKPAPTLTDITQATESFVSQPLEAIYAVKAAAANGTKPVALDPSRRLGIFSQPAVIASHSGPTNSRPVKRGVFWARKVMCMELEPPPNGTDTTIYEIPHTTERQRIEQVTSQKACIGCHKVIDPLGFFQERYDALGRWRELDNGHPIDTSVAFAFLDEGPQKTTMPVEALKVFTNSMMFKQCFVRQLFRFYVGRNEEPSDDRLLRHLFLELAHNDNILELVEELALFDNRFGKRQ